MYEQFITGLFTTLKERISDELVYRDLTQAQLNRAYDNRAAVRDSASCFARWAEDSAALYQSRLVFRDLRYGPAQRQRLDFFPATRVGRPTLFFIHGGYWQWGDKEDEAFVAGGPLAHDINVVNVEYTLCPQISLDGTVAEIDAALDWLCPRLREFNAEPDGVIVGGSSAGAHLAAMMLRRADVYGALLISGVYDLEPIRASRLNEVLRMDRRMARRNSPILHIPARAIPVSFAVGAQELPEMIRQSDDCHAAWVKGGFPSSRATLSAVNHFTIMDELAQPDGRLTTALLHLCRQSV
jgi:acetyl esterase/lipase